MDLKKRLEDVDKKIGEVIKQKVIITTALIQLQSQKSLLEELIRDKKA